MLKTKNILLLKPIIDVSSDFDFEHAIDIISKLPLKKRIISLDSSQNVLITVKKEFNLWRIDLQALREDELPKIANYADGRDESELDIPDGKALSYRNLFLFDPAKKVLGYAKLANCPQSGCLKKCIEIVTKDCFKSITFRFVLVFNNDLAAKLRNAKEITVAEFTSLDMDGQEIHEGNFERYKDYLGGKDYDKTTIIRGKKGINIKSVVQSIIDDVLSGDNGELPIAIKMKIDGENINFSNYYEKFPREVEMDSKNHRYVNYGSLFSAIEDVIKTYEGKEEIC